MEAELLVDAEGYARASASWMLLVLCGVLWTARYLGTACVRMANAGRGSGLLMEDCFGWDVNVVADDGRPVKAGNRVDCEGEVVRGFRKRLARGWGLVFKEVGEFAARMGVPVETFMMEFHWRRWGVVMGCLALCVAVLGWPVREIRAQRMARNRAIRR